MNRRVIAIIGWLAALASVAAGGVARAESPKSLLVALYAPSVDFGDSSARLAYVQWVAADIQRETGIPTEGKAFVRWSDLVANKPDLAIVDALCVAGRSPGRAIAMAKIDGDTAQRWGIYATKARSMSSLAGTQLAYLQTGCRDADFLDHVLLEGDAKASTYFGKLVAKSDATAAVVSVRDYGQAEAVLAPAALARGLELVLEIRDPVPNPAFVVMNGALDDAAVDRVEAALRAGGGKGTGGKAKIDAWVAPQGLDALARRLATPRKAITLAPATPLALEEVDALRPPAATFRLVPLRRRFWLP